MPFFLKILKSPVETQRGMKIPLAEGERLLGRASPPCDVLLSGSKVSKKHCLMRVEKTKITFEDLGSANGVFLNGKRAEKSDLKEKDRLVIGDYLLEVTVG